MHLWHMFLDDVDYLVEEFISILSHKAKHVHLHLHAIMIIICYLI
jgi:hypothetical protein